MRIRDWSSDVCSSDLYRIRIAPGAEVRATGEALKGAFPAAGFEIKDRDRAAPGTSRFFERMGQFLSLIGLAALALAGIGVSNGITSYLAIKRDGIATLKVLGASTSDIRSEGRRVGKEWWRTGGSGGG